MAFLFTLSGRQRSDTCENSTASVRRAPGQLSLVWKTCILDYLLLLLLGLISTAVLCAWVSFALALLPAMSWKAALSYGLNAWPLVTLFFIAFWAYYLSRNAQRLFLSDGLRPRPARRTETTRP